MDDIKQIIGQAGKWSLIGVIVIIVAEYFNVFNVEKFPIPSSWLYIYLFVNGGVSSVMKNVPFRKAKPKLCPNCDSALQVATSYNCPKCGNLHFKKEDAS
ncbi:MAG TPA: hypothetical protein VGA85_02025 [Dehalococcoidales bacterium]